MRRTSGKDAPRQARDQSGMLPDFVTGDRLPQPEVIERDSAEAWQQWLDAVAELECVAEFEPTHPTPLDQAPVDAQGSLRASGP